MSLYSASRRQARILWARTWPLRGRFLPPVSAVNGEQLFFVISSGRSGTQLVSSLLNQSALATVLHEPEIFEDLSALQTARESAQAAESYLSNYRLPAIGKRQQTLSADQWYGEVTGTLRYHLQSLLQLVPEASVFLMARDGRDVVRSVLEKPRFYAPGSSGAWALAPMPDDPWAAEWDALDRFGKICWAWQDTYRKGLTLLPPERLVRFESVVNDFDYFSRYLVQPLGLGIDHAAWQRVVQRKSRNATRKFSHAHWHDWTPEQHQTFDRICGPVMRAFGYGQEG